ncbi:MAG: hypothetical protein KDK34_05970, partial [Leptospiraceae bacterium]|nr:hypothetical protein [Leptospiraceae bacterium]
IDWTGPQYLLLHKVEQRVMITRLEPEAYALLLDLMRGENLCGALAHRHNPDEAIVSHVFRLMAQSGMIAGIQKTERNLPRKESA